ncbi:Possibl zinc metallo-peptidase [Sulfitobacter sp. THAF37]|nr:Possibl zinc metallo-peptidase [Sulfitobacter sp. THAF37]
MQKGPRAFYFTPLRPISAVMTADIPDLDRFEGIARRTVEDFPPPFRSAARDVLLRVTDWPTDEMLASLEIPEPTGLTGLYEGIPMTHKSVMDMAHEPDTVWLFREPILHEWRARGDVEIEDLIAHVTIHEFAHHFGWSDDEIATVAPWQY